MQNANTKTKIVYSLRVHSELLRQGIMPLGEMKNPEYDNLNCWIYDDTEAFRKVFNALIKKEES